MEAGNICSVSVFFVRVGSQISPRRAKKDSDIPSSGRTRSLKCPTPGTTKTIKSPPHALPSPPPPPPPPPRRLYIDRCITQKQTILHTVCILVTFFKYFTGTTFLCGHARDQRSLWFCQEQTELILCYFYLLYRLWPVLKLEELKAKITTRGCEATMLTRTTLTLQRKPENVKDPHAVAIVEDTGSIVGRIPLALSRIVL